MDLLGIAPRSHLLTIPQGSTMFFLRLLRSRNPCRKHLLVRQINHRLFDKSSTVNQFWRFSFPEEGLEDKTYVRSRRCNRFVPLSDHSKIEPGRYSPGTPRSHRRMLPRTSSPCSHSRRIRGGSPIGVLRACCWGRGSSICILVVSLGGD